MRIEKALEEKGFGVSVIDPTVARLKKSASEREISHPFSYALKIAANLDANEKGLLPNHSPSFNKPSEAKETALDSMLEERKQVVKDYDCLFKDIPDVVVRHNDYEMIIEAQGKLKSIPFGWTESEWDKAIELLMPWDRLED